ncbi:MAG: 50S ribosomal protein L4 [Nitrospinota bacterium]
MPKVDVVDGSKNVVGQIELSDSIFAAEKRNESIVHQVVLSQLAGRRRGTHSTKGRSDVRGGGRKPFAQKGLGRARAGTIRSPIWRGGGITFGPKPRDYSFSVPKKMRKLALKTVLTDLVSENRFIVVDSLEIDGIKTKKALEKIGNLKVSMPLLVIYGEGAANFLRSVRNLRDVKTLNVNGLNVYDLLNCETVICTKDAAEAIEKRLAA